MTTTTTTPTWSLTIGRYISLRQQQTQQAYAGSTTQAISSFTSTAKEVENLLFECLLMVLEQSLMEGHTVFRLSATEQSNTAMIDLASLPVFNFHQAANLTTSSLQPWQVQLLLAVLAAWQPLVETYLVSGLASEPSYQLVSQIAQVSQPQFQSQSYPQKKPSYSQPQPQPQNEYTQQQLDGLLLCNIENRQWFNNLLQQAFTTKSQYNQQGRQLLYQQSLAVQLYRLFTQQATLNSLATLQQYLQQSAVFMSVNGDADGLNLPTDNQSASSTATVTAPIVYQYHPIHGMTFWLQRNWYAEQSILMHIQRILHGSHSSSGGHSSSHSTHDSQTEDTQTIKLSTAGLNSEQQQAIEMASQQAFSIITGGPGTGKTYTVAQLVLALLTHSSNSKLALVAPTGKAAQRMQESMQQTLQSTLQQAMQQKQQGQQAEQESIRLPEAQTIHRLLGIGQAGIPKYSEKLPLSADIIIVDEASMLGVELASQLLSAVKTGAKLILLGDAHQLAAVDAGAVLADLCQLEQLTTNHQSLLESRRFTATSGVGKLARFIQQYDKSNIQLEQQPEQMSQEQQSPPAAEHWQVLEQLFSNETALNFYPLAAFSSSTDNHASKQQFTENTISDAAIYRLMSDCYRPYFELTKSSLLQLTDTQLTDAQLTNANDALISLGQRFIQCFNQFRILTAGHHGKLGDVTLNDMLSQAHLLALNVALSAYGQHWYHGRPVMMQQNNYGLGLFNGDIGICLQTVNGLAVYFEQKPTLIAISLLNEQEISTAYAMTIHKSQGSEFEHVAIMLDKSHQRLLSRELIYTAVTRAKEQVSLFATLQDLQTAIASPTLRQTGLNR